MIAFFDASLTVLMNKNLLSKAHWDNAIAPSCSCSGGSCPQSSSCGGRQGMQLPSLIHSEVHGGCEGGGEPGSNFLWGGGGRERREIMGLSGEEKKCPGHLGSLPKARRGIGLNGEEVGKRPLPALFCCCLRLLLAAQRPCPWKRGSRAAMSGRLGPWGLGLAAVTRAFTLACSSTVMGQS